MVTRNTDTGIVETLGLLFIGCSLGSDLSLGRCLGRLVFLLVVCLFVDWAGIFARSE